MVIEMLHTLLHQCQWTDCDIALYCTTTKCYHDGKLTVCTQDLSMLLLVTACESKLSQKIHIYTIECYRV